MIKKTLLVILACVMASEASANTRGVYSTGNDWLWQIQSDHSGTQIAAAAYLSGMNKMHWYSGLAGECVPTPEEVIYGQSRRLATPRVEQGLIASLYYACLFSSEELSVGSGSAFFSPRLANM